jgi:hypothetical protein
MMQNAGFISRIKMIYLYLSLHNTHERSSQVISLKSASYTSRMHFTVTIWYMSEFLPGEENGMEKWKL